MSNYLAIATVTATLANLLEAAVSGDVPGATAKAGRPEKVGNGTPAPTVNVFLYQASPNGAWRNRDLPNRDSEGRVVTRPRAALDLHYLLTFYGDDLTLEPQRLMGSVVRTLHEHPVLSREAVRSAVGSAPFSTFLANSDLAEDVEVVRLSPTVLSLEELSKLWSVFFQAPYALSLSYQATVVLIEGEASAEPGLPVRERKVYVVPFRQPVVDAVTAAAGPTEPIVAGSPVVVVGRALRGDDTRILVDGIEVAPPPAAKDVTDASIPFTLPAGSRAGVHGVQVVHLIDMGAPATPHRGVESNVAAFVLRPQVSTDPGTGEYLISLADEQTAADGTVSADVSVTLVPEVGRRQRVLLLLNELDAPASRLPFAYRFPAPERDPSDPETAATVGFPVAGVRPATYLVRVQVDGAETLLERDPGGKYVAPTLEFM